MSAKPENSAALNSKRRFTIGVIADSMIEGYQIEIWQGIRAAAIEHDVNLFCFVGRELDYEYEYRYIANSVYDLISSERIDGIVAYSATIAHFVDDERVKEFLHRFKIPVVGIAQQVEGVPTLLMDNYLGIKQSVGHLIEAHGCKRIAFYKTTEGHPEGEERFEAYKEILASHNIPFDPNLVIPGKYFNFPEDGIKYLLDERKASFDAIVAVDDYIALPVKDILQARGYKVPEEVAVVGFDDIEDCRYTTPPLTTIRQPLHLQGQRALELVLEQINGQKVDSRVMLSPQLVIRQSCGCLHPDVLEAAVQSPSGSSSPEKPAENLAETRGQIIVKIEAKFSKANIGSFPALFDSFLNILEGQAADQFLAILNNALSEEFNRGFDIATWQSILSTLRSHVLAYLETGDRLNRAENIFQQARVMIADVSQRAQAQRRLFAQNQAITFRNLGQAINTTLDFQKLLDVIANNLPGLEIPECYISLYPNHDPNEANCNLILALNSQGRAALPLAGLLFPKNLIIPESYLDTDQRFTYMVEPLYFQTENYGFIVLKTTASDETLYDNLAQQLSSALKGTYLVQQVERRAVQLQTASEVSRAASNILDPEELIQNTVELVRDRFDLYYAGLFLVDEAGKWAVLHAGTGEAGRQMIAQHWKLEVGGGSMIGRCLATGTPDVQLDVDKAPVHLRNPHLPETRSEMALPLTSRGETIGALSIQSAKPQAFTLEDASILQTMANQIASAIQNTRLYNQTQAALIEMQATQRHYLEQAWTEYNKTSDKTGYMKADATVISLGGDLLPEVQQAMKEKKPVLLNGNQDSEPVLAVPILLRDQPIGALGFHLPPGKRAWNQDDIAVAEAISEQFGLAAESLRLLDVTQRRAARERLVTEITTKIRATNDPQTMLQTATMEIRKALQAKRAQVLIQPEEGSEQR